MRRRRRDAEGGRGRLQRHPRLDRLHQGETTGQSELGVSVQLHPRPPFERRSGKTHSLEGGPDGYVSRSQPVWAGQLGSTQEPLEPSGTITSHPSTSSSAWLAQPDEPAARALEALGGTREAVRARIVERLRPSAPRPDGPLGVAPQTKRLSNSRAPSPSGSAIAAGARSTSCSRPSRWR
jgi:hypothetical protein